MNPRDLYLDMDDAPCVAPTFVHGMVAEPIDDQVRDVPVTFEDREGRVYDCVVAYDGDTVAWVTGYDERGNRAEFTDEQTESIIAIAARKT
jgi:hypothetical protein